MSEGAQVVAVVVPWRASRVLSPVELPELEPGLQPLEICRIENNSVNKLWTSC